MIKKMVLTTGFLSRTSTTTTFPGGGWRWQYAMARALDKSGFSVPHTIGIEYLWAEKMAPYVKAEVLKINKKELEREQALARANQYYDDNFKLFEAEAIKRGLAPHRMTRSYSRSLTLGKNYTTNLEPGKWWILATHKVPALKYYWLLPVQVEANKNNRFVLNEDNAIYVEGAW